MMALTIARRELARTFASPLAWTVLGVVQAVLAWIFLVQVDEFVRLQPSISHLDGAPGVTDFVITPIFGPAAIILMMVVPLLSMRSLAEERRARTLPLLFSSPVRMTDIVLGKYLALVGFIAIIVLMLAGMALTLGLGTELDLGKLATAVLGLLLVASAFAAVGLYMSSLTSYPAVAAVASFGLLLFLWIVDMAARGGGEGSEVFEYVSLTQHYRSFFMGIIDTRDLAFYLIFIGVFLALSVRRLDAERLQG